jgi:hypothetical protein
VAAIEEAGDIQAVVDRGFGSLAGATHLLLKVNDPEPARSWLRTLQITSLAEAMASRLNHVRQLAFTASGLLALGFDPEKTGGFAPEFLDGMAGNERKSAQLGDVGANSPSNWQWGAGERGPHVLILLLAPLAGIAALEEDHVAAAKTNGFELLYANRTNGLLGNEPFGFADGLSQPEPDWEGTISPGGARDRAYRNRIAAGEFILGHRNEYGFVADYPSAKEVGRNGSYLVYRQLKQDVRGFWQWVSQTAGRDRAIELAELMVGRKINGDPLTVPKPGPKNEFTYGGDPDGLCCPIGAHIRRANPRSGDDPRGPRGFFGDIIARAQGHGHA